MKRMIVHFMIFNLIILSYGMAFCHDDVAIHGFISQGYLKSDHNDFLAETEKGSFQFNEMGLNFSTWFQTN